MKATAYALSVLLAVAPGAAWALNCTASPGYSQLSQSNISTLLSGNTACYPSSGAPNNQEAHSGGTSGTITDFKKGPSDPNDPSSQVGTYAIDGSGNITYNYSGGPTFVYSVWGATPPAPGVYDFCTGTTPLPGQVRVAGGSGGC